jgi:ribosomal protein L14E/L6E/L27E
MNDLVIGSFAVSRAGHDFGKQYVIFLIDNEYVYLVDGRIRTLDRPKRKKTKHILMLDQFDVSLAGKVADGSVKNEEIKRALKLLQIGYSKKEVE